MGVLALVAFSPRITLWGLTELKMEVLAQVSPLFLLGLTWKRFTARAALAGLVGGTTLAMGLTLYGYAKVWDIHAGVLGGALNFLLCLIVSSLSSPPAARD